MSEDIRELQRLTQRAMAAAHQVDQRLESPASARVIVAARVFLAEVDKVCVVEQPWQYKTLAGVLTAEAPAPDETPWPQIGDDIVIKAGQELLRRGRVKFEYEHLGERAFHCEWSGGSFEALVSECLRP